MEECHDKSINRYASRMTFKTVFGWCINVTMQGHKWVNIPRATNLIIRYVRDEFTAVIKLFKILLAV
jgi:hypothetical protein